MGVLLLMTIAGNDGGTMMALLVMTIRGGGDAEVTDEQEEPIDAVGKDEQQEAVAAVAPASEEKPKAVSSRYVVVAVRGSADDIQKVMVEVEGPTGRSSRPRLSSRSVVVTVAVMMMTTTMRKPNSSSEMLCGETQRTEVVCGG